MSGKVRRIDFYPDEYIAGVGGVLRADEQGVYWMVCALITSQGGPIEYNDRRISGLCCMRPSDLRRVVERLIELGKVTLTSDGKLSQKRAQSEVELSAKRIQSAVENGSKGGRPPKINVENQSEKKADGLFSGNLTTNYQLPTTKEDKKEEDTSLRSVAPAASKPKATRLSETWILPEDFRKWAFEKGLPSERIVIEADKMRNWSINAGRVGAKVDWFAAWRNWVQKAIDELPRRSARGSPDGPRGLEWFDEAAKWIDENGQERAETGAGRDQADAERAHQLAIEHRPGDGESLFGRGK